MPREETAWAVHCPSHGKVYLTKKEYDAQMNRPDSRWMCPICTELAWWDDDHYEEFVDRKIAERNEARE
jgi:hypothetical protein